VPSADSINLFRWRRGFPTGEPADGSHPRRRGRARARDDQPAHQGCSGSREGTRQKAGRRQSNLRAIGDKGREISRAVRIKKATDRVADLSPIIAEIRASGIMSLGKMAKALNERGIRTPRGSEWQPTQVKRVLERIVA
jgi:hypothetical protein